MILIILQKKSAYTENPKAIGSMAKKF
jgi:hypothetical protein